MTLDPLLAWVALGHAVLALACAGMLAVTAVPLLGVHPALKPMKFALSIAIFLGTLAVLLPKLTLGPVSVAVLRWSIAIAMIVEMIPIAVQPLRGTTSHFNMRTRLDAVTWRIMMAAIIVLTLAMLGVAIAATVRPLVDATALETLGWRAGLWLFPLAAVSGFAMGGRNRHSIGGDDGGPGLPIMNWSVTHGDLRVSHFLAMHALQLLPAIALALGTTLLAPAVQWTVLAIAIAGTAMMIVWTLVRAFAGQPLVRRIR